MKVEKFVPISRWTEDSGCHHLQVDLPGFKGKEVELEVENSRRIRVSGERVISEKKISFEERYKLPENSSNDYVSSKFEREILHIIVPKKKETTNVNRSAAINGIKEEESEHENEKPNNNIEKDSNKYELESSGHGHGHGQKEEKMRETSGEREGFEQENREVIRGEAEKCGNLLESLMEKLNKNKGILMILVFAFSLGTLVSHRKSKSTRRP